ncbi:hypothetical protein ACX1NX_11435 [Acinetobacter sp. ANC 5383]
MKLKSATLGWVFNKQYFIFTLNKGEFMKRIVFGGFVSVMLVVTAANAEIVTNSKGEKIELRSNGTWSTIKAKGATSKKLVADHDSLILKIRDGNDKLVGIQTFVKFEGDSVNSVSEKELTSLVNLTGFAAKIRLKNEYSYIPKVAMATFKNGGVLSIYLKYTAKNSYGAEVVDGTMSIFTLTEKGEYTLR